MDRPNNADRQIKIILRLRDIRRFNLGSRPAAVVTLFDCSCARPLLSLALASESLAISASHISFSSKNRLVGHRLETAKLAIQTLSIIDTPANSAEMFFLAKIVASTGPSKPASASQRSLIQMPITHRGRDATVLLIGILIPNGTHVSHRLAIFWRFPNRFRPFLTLYRTPCLIRLIF